MELLYFDDRIVVCIKPAGVLSTDEPGGLPELVRQALGDPHAVVKTVHRLDRAVSGLMVLARTSRAASDLGKQVQDGTFHKEYMAVLHGMLLDEGELRDFLVRDKARKMTFIANQPGKDTQEAILRYWVTGRHEDLTKVRISLVTGRTHQIRVQFSGRDLPLVGDRKYSSHEDDCGLALWSCKLTFNHPRTGERMEFFREPPEVYPWNQF